jgi:hypothetical protein
LGLRGLEVEGLEVGEHKGLRGLMGSLFFEKGCEGIFCLLKAAYGDSGCGWRG